MLLHQENINKEVICESYKTLLKTFVYSAPTSFEVYISKPPSGIINHRQYSKHSYIQFVVQGTSNGSSAFITIFVIRKS